MARTSLLHQPERLRSFEQRLRQLWLEAKLNDLPLLVGDKFQVVRLLGRGASAVVCEADDRKWRTRAAVKLFPRVLDEDYGFQRVHEEALSLRRLEHPNIVRVHDFDRDLIYPGDLPCYWLSMELVAGEPLRHWLGKQPGDAAVLSVLRQIGEGLAYAHEQGVVHRDFKPENVMLTADGVPKLVDFGLAAPMTAASSEGAVGTPAFMAPEALLGRADARSDQFSFAATLWLALCRDFPYDPTSHDPRDRGCLRPPRDGIDSRVLACLRRALEPAPERRFPTIRALLDELDAAAIKPSQSVALAIVPSPAPREAEAPVVMRRLTPAPLPEIVDAEVLPRRRSPAHRRTRWVGFALMGGSLASAGVGVAWYGGSQAPEVLADVEPPPPAAAAHGDPPAPEPEVPVPVAAPAASNSSISGLPAPPGCAIPAAVAGAWSFATAVESASSADLKERVGRYKLKVRVDVAKCALAATFEKLGNDSETYTPPLKAEGTLEFSVVRPFTGRLQGTFEPRVPWSSAAYAYDVAFIIDGDELYGSFKARGKARFEGLLRGGRGPRPAPSSEVTRARQPCFTQCDLRCPLTDCAAACAAPWSSPDCPALRAKHDR